VAGATVAPVEHVLADVEGRPVDQSLVAPLMNLSVTVQFANVEPVAEDAGSVFQDDFAARSSQ
jgi:hypothetical protein